MSTIKTASKILFLIRKGPYGTAHIKESIDAILAALTLDMIVSVVFLDDGVWQLKSEQQPQMLAEKNYTATFKALPQYGDINIYVESESLTERSLSVNDLIIAIKELKRNGVAQFSKQHDIILSF
jgi:tRNA 2-thiouridine synthesizing protein C